MNLTNEDLLAIGRIIDETLETKFDAKFVEFSKHSEETIGRIVEAGLESIQKECFAIRTRLDSISHDVRMLKTDGQILKIDIGDLKLDMRTLKQDMFGVKENFDYRVKTGKLIEA